MMLSDEHRQPLQTAQIQEAVQHIKQELARVIIGQQQSIDLLLATIFSGGHALVEGVPGVAKTLISKLLAQTLDIHFARIQFTPDLMPSDILGTTVFNQKTADFSFNPGPIFAQLLLIDEINRAPAKTQSALFEVMEEYQVTVDGKTYPMDQPFFVIATQNPIEQEGTYKLPEAQLDRFMMKIHVGYPALEEEKQILQRFQQDFGMKIKRDVQRMLSPRQIIQCRQIVENVWIDPGLIDYIAGIVHATRDHRDIYLGASPRASLAILKTSKAIAAIRGRDFVTPEDIQLVAFPVLTHRLILQPEREMEGAVPADIIQDILQQMEIPR